LLADIRKPCESRVHNLRGLRPFSAIAQILHPQPLPDQLG
jgi:hypothetical protein